MACNVKHTLRYEFLLKLLLTGLHTSTGEQFTFCFIQNIDFGVESERTSMIGSDDSQMNVTLVNTTDQYRMYSNNESLIQHSPLVSLRNTGKENKGLRILTEGNIPIVSFSRSFHYSGDIITPFPDRLLGTHHVVLTFCFAGSRCIVAVVGMIDGATDVAILLPSTFKGDLIIDNRHYYAGEEFHTTLYMLETFQLLSVANLSGVIVRSSHKVGIFVGSDRTMLRKGGGNDHLEEALPPIELWGKQYILIRKGRDLLQIVSSANDTHVNITGCDKHVHYVIHAFNDVIEFMMECEFSYVSATSPILVAHFMKSTNNNKNPSLYFPTPVMLYSKIYAVTPTPSPHAPCQVGLVAEMDDLEDITGQLTNDNVAWTNVSSTRFAVTTVKLHSAKTVIVRSRNKPFGGHLSCQIKQYITGSTRLAPYTDDTEIQTAPMSTTTAANGSSQNCASLCCNRPAVSLNLTVDEQRAIFKELKTQLMVKKTATSAWKRKLSSANDDRPSSQRIGLLATVFLICGFGSMVLVDLVNFVLTRNSPKTNPDPIGMTNM